MKPTTIPRLELTAATVSSKVAKLVRKQLNLQNLSEFYWTDSQIVIGYITNEARRFRIFVANRVQLINDNTDKANWRYVESSENPSDSASRGITMEDKSDVERWFSGPEFLWKSVDGWKEDSTEFPVDNNDFEIQTIKHANVILTNPTECLLETITKRISDWNKKKTCSRHYHLFH